MVRGRKGGRPKTYDKKLKQAVKLYDSREYTLREIVDLTGVSKPTLYRELEKRKQVI